mmetsp:Transcript_9204/g.16668  ORF Transcript_9204/g.16668 Transcript_9204/m.16668 type:complete len:244 (-) Transcript_9204:976-1707(-)
MQRFSRSFQVECASRQLYKSPENHVMPILRIPLLNNNALPKGLHSKLTPFSLEDARRRHQWETLLSLIRRHRRPPLSLSTPDGIDEHWHHPKMHHRHLQPRPRAYHGHPRPFHCHDLRRRRYQREIDEALHLQRWPACRFHSEWYLVPSPRHFASLQPYRLPHWRQMRRVCLVHGGQPVDEIANGLQEDDTRHALVLQHEGGPLPRDGLGGPAVHPPALPRAFGGEKPSQTAPARTNFGECRT